MPAGPTLVAHRYLVRQACLETLSKQPKTASQIDRVAFMALAEGFVERQAGWAGILKKVTKLLVFLKKSPRVLERIRDMIGELTPDNIRRWAEDGKRALQKALQQAAHSFPLGIFFHPKAKLPTLTEMVSKIMRDTKVGKFLENEVKPRVDKLDSLFQQHLPRLRRPLLAAIYIFVWLNVAEMSWDFSGLLDGFTGAISLSDLLSSLPESALGFLMSGFGLGFHLLPILLVARIVWLVAQNYIEWDSGSGTFKVHWNLLGAQGNPQ